MVYPLTVRLEKNERVIDLQSWSIAELRAGVAATFDLPPEDTEDLSLVCFCSDGRKIFLGNDRDLVRAINPRATILKVHAMYGRASKKSRARKVETFYDTAARSLRVSHGVPSITASSLRQAMSLLELHPHRLVSQGLVPLLLPQRRSTAPSGSERAQGSGPGALGTDPRARAEGEAVMAEKQRPHHPLSPDCAKGTTDCGHTELMSDYEDSDADGDDEQVEDGDADGEGSRGNPWQPAPHETLPGDGRDEQEKGTGPEEVVFDGGIRDDETEKGREKDEGGEEDDEDEEEEDETSVAYEALRQGGVHVHPLEVSALLHGLGVDARRLVRLGLISREAIGQAAPGVGGSCELGEGTGEGRPRDGRKRIARRGSPRAVRLPVRLVGRRTHPRHRGRILASRNSCSIIHGEALAAAGSRCARNGSGGTLRRRHSVAVTGTASVV